MRMSHMAKTTHKRSSNRKANGSKSQSVHSPASANKGPEIRDLVLEVGTATAAALRRAADQIDEQIAAAAKNKQDPSRALVNLHAVLAGPLVGGLMVATQD